MTGLYPLKFKPVLKERIWGGDTLARCYNKESENTGIGESWEISAVQGDQSIVANGFLEGNNLEEIIEVYMGDLVGDEVYDRFGDEFPLLVKLIDAVDKLSVQVHPDDQLARERHNAYGKTEMWHVLEAAPGAVIYNGFRRDSSPEEIFAEGADFDAILNRVPALPGDTFFIPAGRVHAIGGGVVLAEIQQTSDITYRVHDWNRVGSDGKARELHGELAADAIDYSACIDAAIRVQPEINDSVNLVDCSYFTTNLLSLEGRIEKDYTGFDTFVILLCIDGQVDLNYTTGGITLEKGETVLLPATTGAVSLKSNPGRLLEIYINNHHI